MRVVKVGVRNHCVLQQFCESAGLGLSKGTLHQATKNLRQKPTAEAVWVNIENTLSGNGNRVCKSRNVEFHIAKNGNRV